MAWNPVKEAEKAAKRAVDKVVKPAAEEIKRGVNRAGDEVKGGVKKVGREIEGGVKKVGHEVEEGIHKVGHEVEEGIHKVGREIEDKAAKALEHIEEGVDEVLKAILEEASRGTFTKAVDIAQTLAPDAFALTIGPLSLDIKNIKDRIDTLQQWANNPPSSSEDIKECIKTLAPTRVTVKVDVQFALLVVTSEVVKVGFAASWDTSSFLDKFDDIIRHFE